MATFTRSEADQALRRVDDAIKRYGVLCYELDEQRLRRSPDAHLLQGASAQAWDSAEQLVGVLWTWYRALTDAVDPLTARRQAGRLNESELEDTRRVLTDPSVSVPADSIAVARRYLSGTPELASPATIDVVLAVMSSAYDRATEVVTSIGAIPDAVLPRVGEMDRKLDAVETAAGAAGVRVGNAVALHRSQVAQLRERCACDPMSIDPQWVNQLEAETVRLVADLGREISAVEEVGTDLEALQPLVGSVGDLLREARAAQEIAAVKVLGEAADWAGLDAAAAECRALEEDLARATREAGSDRAAAARFVVRARERAEDLRIRAVALLEAANAPLTRRRELRGRLDAYQAKVSALGLAENLRLEELRSGAEACLYSAPCDLDEAEQRLVDYQRAISRQTS